MKIFIMQQDENRSEARGMKGSAAFKGTSKRVIGCQRASEY